MPSSSSDQRRIEVVHPTAPHRPQQQEPLTATIARLVAVGEAATAAAAAAAAAAAGEVVTPRFITIGKAAAAGEVVSAPAAKPAAAAAPARCVRGRQR